MLQYKCKQCYNKKKDLDASALMSDGLCCHAASLRQKITKIKNEIRSPLP